MAQGYDDARRKAGEKGSNGITVTERKSEVAGEFGLISCRLWMRLNSLTGMSNAEVKYMLKNCAWTEVTMM